MGGPGAPPATRFTRCNLSPEVTHEGFPASLNLSKATIEKNMGRGGAQGNSQNDEGTSDKIVVCLLIQALFLGQGGGIGGIYPYILMKQVT